MVLIGQIGTDLKEGNTVMFLFSISFLYAWASVFPAALHSLG